LASITTGDYNSAFGVNALLSNKSGNYNTAIGINSLYKNTGNNNTASGSSALFSNTTGANNTASGYQALFSNTSGTLNTASGVDALKGNTTGSRNTAIGERALYRNTSGFLNTASGSGALYNNTTGYRNTASGYDALFSNTTGYYNTASGLDALYSNTSGIQNTASGVDALKGNTTGSRNTASGYGALHINTTGNKNTAVGSMALRNNYTGSFNTAIGDSAGAIFTSYNSTYVGYKAVATVNGLTNVTVVGSQATATASNQVRIGNTAVTSIGGKVGWTTLSDGRYKKNIQADVPGLEFITKLRPVTYTLDIAAIDKASGITEQGGAEQVSARAAAAKVKHTGFIAQEVEKAAEDLKYDFGGVDKPKNDRDYYGLRYAEFVVPLVKGMQEQQNEIVKQQQQIELQQQQIEDLKAMVTRLANGQVVSTNTLTSVYLEQNTPNPVSGTTTIRYHLPETSTSARLTLTNVKGQVVKTISLGNKGTGQVSLSTSSLAAGTYHYTLYVDGKQTDSKRLIVAR
jgi:hypothetical protein